MALFAGVRSMVDLVLMSYILLAWAVIWWFMVRRNAQRPALSQTRQVLSLSAGDVTRSMGGGKKLGPVLGINAFHGDASACLLVDG